MRYRHQFYFLCAGFSKRFLGPQSQYPVVSQMETIGELKKASFQHVHISHLHLLSAKLASLQRINIYLPALSCILFKLSGHKKVNLAETDYKNYN